jgi:hypothetical protein
MRARRRTACLGPSTKEADMPGGTRRIALLVTLAAFFVPSALASTHTLTKAQVIKRGTVICKTAARRVEATPAPRSQNPFGKTAPEGDRARAEVHRRLRQLARKRPRRPGEARRSA